MKTLSKFNGANGAKEAGKWRLEGKDSIVAKMVMSCTSDSTCKNT